MSARIYTFRQRQPEAKPGLSGDALTGVAVCVAIEAAFCLAAWMLWPIATAAAWWIVGAG